MALKNYLISSLATPSTVAASKSLTKKKKQSTTPEVSTYPLASTYMPLQEYNTKSSGSGGGAVSYSSTVKPYLNDMIAAYRQGADANKAAAKMAYDNTMRDLKTSLDRAQASYNTGVANANQAYENTRSNLLTSIKRFQEENAKNVENQKRAYLTDQAALEAARLEADRQTRISNAARGLGGSGLQQLAQLQNLINQGQDISNLAASNQSEMDNLRKQMLQAQEDHNRDLAEAEQARKNTEANLLTVLNNAKADTTTREADALATYYAALQGIDANLANQIADANYNFGQNAYSASRSGGSSDTSTATNLTILQDNVNRALNALAGASKKEVKSLADSLGFSNPNKVTKSQIANAYIEDALNNEAVKGAQLGQYNTLKNNLNSILSRYGY